MESRSESRSTSVLDPTQRAAGLAARFREVRSATLALAAPLSPEDCAVQSMTEASPVKWHLAHTSWFFETFVLARALADFEPFHPQYSYLYNSYYDAVGERVARPRRGLQTRPSLEQVRAWRRHVDARVAEWLATPAAGEHDDALDALELGVNHEQQHQELILTDIKHLLWHNALDPVYAPTPPRSEVAPAEPLAFVPYEGGVQSIGHAGAGFAFDNEGPAHELLLRPFELASRPVTCGEYLDFVEAGGYREPRWWLSEGWEWVGAQRVEAPLYWRREAQGWSLFTLAGRRPLDPDEPVAHVSFYEAEAYARFRDARLPLEAEWESAAREAAVRGNFAESGALHPRPTPAARAGGVAGLFGDVWEWTASPYVAYPGYRPAEGALGEYNGKFMVNQLVLRGGSCVSPRDHLRASYRNFFHAPTRWQFSGLRLARDA